MASEDGWDDLYAYSDFVRAGDTIYFSGQVGLDAEGKPPTDPAEQYKLAFASITRLLEEAGCTADNVVDIMSYHTDYPEHMDKFMAAKAEFQGGARPAWTAVGVAKLGMPESLVEIKVIAHAPQG